MAGQPWLGQTPKTPYQNGTNKSLPGGLFNDTDARQLLQREKPVHRLIISLAQAGLTPTEIAAKVGMTITHVSQVLRQPWARQQIVNGLKQSIQDELKQMLEGEAKPALERIVELSKESADETIRTRNNQYLINRILGMPTQPVEDKTTEPEKLSYDELERRVAAIAGRFPVDGGVETPES